MMIADCLPHTQVVVATNRERLTSTSLVRLRCHNVDDIADVGGLL
jgi:hypothetical protein